MSLTRPETPVYLAGLVLRGRRVLVVGAGRIATRRIPRLLDAGAHVDVVAPDATDAIQALASAGKLTWHQRAFTEPDADGAWYVLAVTDVPGVNAAVAAAAGARHTFCVRADDASGGSAWTAAGDTVDGITFAILGRHDPELTKRLRRIVGDAVADTLAQEPPAPVE